MHIDSSSCSRELLASREEQCYTEVPKVPTCTLNNAIHDPKRLVMTADSGSRRSLFFAQSTGAFDSSFLASRRHFFASRR